MTRKYKKRRVRLLDNHTSSTITSHVETDRWHDSEDAYVEISIDMTDCTRKLCWHDFGNKKQATAKINNIIKAFEDVRDDMEKAYESKKELDANKKPKSKKKQPEIPVVRRLEDL